MTLRIMLSTWILVFIRSARLGAALAWPFPADGTMGGSIGAGPATARFLANAQPPAPAASNKATNPAAQIHQLGSPGVPARTGVSAVCDGAIGSGVGSAIEGVITSDSGSGLLAFRSLADTGCEGSGLLGTERGATIGCVADGDGAGD